MLPAVFGENLFDEMFDNRVRPMHSMKKALYGKYAKTIMKTDARETDNSYEVDVDLPCFKKEEVNIQLEDGSLTVGAAKGVQPKDVHANFEDGFLKLSLPKAEKPELPDHRTITIGYALTPKGRSCCGASPFLVLAISIPTGYNGGKGGKTYAIPAKANLWVNPRDTGGQRPLG